MDCKVPIMAKPRMNIITEKLQRKVELESGSSHPKNFRLHGEPSTRPPPPSSPAWAIGDLDRDSDPTSPSLQPLSPYPESPCSP